GERAVDVREDQLAPALEILTPDRDRQAAVWIDDVRGVARSRAPVRRERLAVCGWDDADRKCVAVRDTKLEVLPVAPLDPSIDPVAVDDCGLALDEDLDLGIRAWRIDLAAGLAATGLDRAPSAREEYGCSHNGSSDSS